MTDTPCETITSRIIVTPASDPRHPIVTGAQLDALRALVITATRSSR